ncbi:hypothetical protein [Cohnella soli]|uniref:DUF4309 domain-containing protein n=1 Tax=Cohnella soli TaxID=425005 RepID=A0ABW0HSU4_9BACL
MGNGLKKPMIIAVMLIFSLIIIFTSIVLYKSRNNILARETLDNINRNLISDGVQLNLKEEELTKLLGDGEYMEGFGGHMRKYASRSLNIGISGDQDNDFYGHVSQVDFSNPEFSIYGIKVGDPIEQSSSYIISKGYHQIAENIFRNGEYVIQLYGHDNIQSIKIWFDDKDLRGRSY